jgi:hypothetical protein
MFMNDNNFAVFVSTLLLFNMYIFEKQNGKQNLVIVILLSVPKIETTCLLSTWTKNEGINMWLTNIDLIRKHIKEITCHSAYIIRVKYCLVTSSILIDVNFDLFMNNIPTHCQ